jgi:UDP-N-acetylglucosamine--N-acetylmuramyl-(pentapeptide) pyrophosphoryl-undecaprenol N-acetylglucosamine transferase
MSEKSTTKRIIISGGGTGGHIFPAVAIANEVRRRDPQADILFVGAEGKMEMEKVPAAGFPIQALPIVGLQRRLTVKNLLLPFKLAQSLWMARRILKAHKPDVVVGVGGYASGPILKMANWLRIPTVIQEQNSFAGKTNKLLAQQASKICVAYEQMERFFPKEKIVLTGNPVRNEVAQIEGKRTEALNLFGLTEEKPVVLVIGGSLGARTLNQALDKGLMMLVESDVQVIWQCGKFYKNDLWIKWNGQLPDGVWLDAFITDMQLAYAAADIVVSRAGALSVSELCLVHKPAILVPSPNVAEDHQTKNAMALVEKGAAILVTDHQAEEQLIDAIRALVTDMPRQEKLTSAIRLLGKPDATRDIVNIIEEVAGWK